MSIAQRYVYNCQLYIGDEYITWPLLFRICPKLQLAYCSSLCTAQTLNEQYDYYLANNCENMNFERVDADQVAPGLAGSNLASYCGRPGANQPGAIGTNSAGGASATRGTNTSNPLAREHKERKDEDDGATVSIFSGERLGVFMTASFQREDRTATEFEAGSDADGLNALLGADYRFADNRILGLAISQISLDGDFSGGGKFDSSHRTLWLFGAWFPKALASGNGFANAQIGLGQGENTVARNVGRETTFATSEFIIDPDTMIVTEQVTYSTRPDIAFTLTDGNADTQSQNAVLTAGYDFRWASFTLGPRLAANYLKTTRDSFTESGATPMTLSFDAFDEKSLTSSLGLQVSRTFNTGFGVIKTQLDADWLHEWSANQQTLTATFAEDLRANPTVLSFQNQAPDQNWFNLRLGAVLILPHQLNAFITAEQTASHALIDKRSLSLGVRKVF